MVQKAALQILLQIILPSDCSSYFYVHFYLVIVFCHAEWVSCAVPRKSFAFLSVVITILMARKGTVSSCAFDSFRKEERLGI